MKRLTVSTLALFVLASGLPGQDVTARARDSAAQGDSAGARTLLQRAAQDGDVAALSAYAEFLDLYNDPEARAANERLLASLPAGTNDRRAAVLRRLAMLDLIAGDRAEAGRRLAAYREAGGAPLSLPELSGSEEPKLENWPTIDIPGPLRSVSRMAALSPDLKPEDLLPALARNVVTNGYQALGGTEGLEQTEYLKLVFRYLSQARELEKLAGPDKVIKVPSCDSSETADLLRVLGYRMRGGCGSDVVVETVNATRAFLTIDSGFPLVDLEQALRANRPFEYDFHPTKVPVLFGPEYWRSAKEKQGQEFVDMFLSDPALCRLYLGMSKLDPETAEQMRKAVPAQRVRSFAHVLDFFGGMFQIRNGRAAIPGTPRTEKVWTDLVGVSPEEGAKFYERLIMKDDGWMASFLDALLRIRGPVLDYLTEPARMRRFYMAIRGRVTSPGPARPVFRSNTDMMLLTTRLRVGPDGKPVVPGNLEVWKRLFTNHPAGKYDGRLTRAASSWKDPDDLVEALFGLCRKSVENEPLKIYMALSDLDRKRARPLEPETVDRLARNYKQLGSQYAIFNEVPTLRDQTINEYLDATQAMGEIRDPGLRADAAGTMQALVSLWQIFCRQESIAAAGADSILAAIIAPFAGPKGAPRQAAGATEPDAVAQGRIRGPRDVFDAGYNGTKLLLKAARVKAETSPQDAMIDLLAGVQTHQDVESHTQMVEDMMRIFEAQRLVSLKTIFDLEDNLESLSRGEKLNTALVNRLASRINEIQLPRAALSTVEKNAFAFGFWTDRHIEGQRKLNLRAAIEKAASDPAKLKEVRGLLAPVLRDTLVGLNYTHYAPPGAQVLLTNPLFVRGHDFIGMQGTTQTWKQTEMYGTGWPSNAGGRLVGSLSGLPYALAEAEQNFMIPKREQALIWGDLVPQMILMAKVPRWWNVTPTQMHWVELHTRLAESALAESALDAKVRERLLAALANHAAPARAHLVGRLLAQGRVATAANYVTPSEEYTVAQDLLASEWTDAGPVAAEIRRLAKAAPAQVSPEAISRAFGTPKPTLANSYRPELLNLRTFPTLMGYSSRIMAESWESNLLYYATLADELHAQPSQLNVLVPEWTQKTVEQIFATHLEDWPALLRSLRAVGDDIRTRSRKAAAANQNASLP